MADQKPTQEIIDTLSAPMGDIIASIGLNLADAQRELDAQTIENFKSIYAEGAEAFTALRSIGYRPTWYQIPEATADIKIAMSIKGEIDAQSESDQKSASSAAGRRFGIQASTMNATYSNRFNYDVNGSSSLKFRIVPIPPPAAAEDMRVAPNVTGLTYKQAVTLLERLDTAYVAVTGTGEPPAESEEVVEQYPAAGEIIPTGGSLELRFNIDLG